MLEPDDYFIIDYYNWSADFLFDSVCWKYVYWSDVRERVIYRAHLDGTNKTVFLDSTRGIGIVDGNEFRELLARFICFEVLNNVRSIR